MDTGVATFIQLPFLALFAWLVIKCFGFYLEKDKQTAEIFERMSEALTRHTVAITDSQKSLEEIKNELKVLSDNIRDSFEHFLREKSNGRYPS